MNVMVTGATGFIGRHLVGNLVARGHKVIAVARAAARAKTMAWFHNVGFVGGDIHTARFAEELAASQPDVLVHLAWPGLPNYQELFHYEENLPASYRFIKGMLEHGCRRILVAGTCFEYGLQCGQLSEDGPVDPVTPYALAKDTLRRFLMELKKKNPFILQWARLFYLYGNGQNPNSLLAQLDRVMDDGGKVFNMSGGEQLRDYLPVEKAAGLLASLIELPEADGVFNCCSGKPVSVRSLVENRIRERGMEISLKLGHYSYPEHEPMAFWGNAGKLAGAMKNANNGKGR